MFVKKTVSINRSKCRRCSFCVFINKCYSVSKCTGCLSCYYSCPYNARVVREEVVESINYVNIVVNGVKYSVPSGLTIASALEIIGYKFSKPGSRKPSLPCGTGGCWACALVVNGSLTRTCITPVEENIFVDTNIENKTPLRIVHGPEPHLVGGKATPWWEVDYIHYVETAIWVAGCNLRCPQCQNYYVTYDNTSSALTPREAVEKIVTLHRLYGTKGLAISGGEPAINRRWLVEYFKILSKYTKPKVRIHLDSNGTVLTPDYIDELVEAGCNNIGIEPKCLNIDTYLEITGLTNRELAKEYLETAWKAIDYVYDNYREKVYLGIGIVYNKKLVSLKEIEEIGYRIARIDPSIQVTVLDYFPTFRRRDIERPYVDEMLHVKKILEECGLKTVVVQTTIGHIGPGKGA